MTIENAMVHCARAAPLKSRKIQLSVYPPRSARRHGTQQTARPNLNLPVSNSRTRRGRCCGLTHGPSRPTRPQRQTAADGCVPLHQARDERAHGGHKPITHRTRARPRKGRVVADVSPLFPSSQTRPFRTEKKPRQIITETIMKTIPSNHSQDRRRTQVKTSRNPTANRTLPHCLLTMAFCIPLLV